MKEYKLHMTRPEYMKQILTQCNSAHRITEEDLVEMLEKGYLNQYCSYTVLMNADLEPSDILQVHDDAETVVVKLKSKSLAKTIKEQFHREIMELGHCNYCIKVKVDGQYVFISAKLVEDD